MFGMPKNVEYHFSTLYKVVSIYEKPPKSFMVYILDNLSIDTSLAILAAIHVLAIMAITAILRKWPLWHKLLSPGIKPNLASKMYILKCLKGDLNIKHFKWQYAIFETCLQIIWGLQNGFLSVRNDRTKKFFFQQKNYQ